MAQTLLESGNLRTLVRGTGDDAWRELLSVFSDPRTEVASDSPVVRAIEDLRQQHLEHAAMLQERIREAVQLLSSHVPLHSADSLTVGAQAAAVDSRAPGPSVAPQLWDTNRVPEEDFAALVRLTGSFVLHESLSGGVPGGVSAVLRRARAEPGRAVAATIQNFVEMALNAGRASRDWEALYQSWAPQIWLEEYERAAGNSLVLRELLDRIRRANGLVDALANPIGAEQEGLE